MLSHKENSLTETICRRRDGKNGTCDGPQQP